MYDGKVDTNVEGFNDLKFVLKGLLESSESQIFVILVFHHRVVVLVSVGSEKN